MLGRRGIIGSLVGAFTAGPKALETAIEGMGTTLSNPLPMTATATEVIAGAVMPSMWQKPWALLPEPLQKIYNVAINRLQDDIALENAIIDRCHNGFDPDIAANVSWSNVYKAHVQAERMIAKRMAERALRERVWG